jgi:hypothetical protein
MSIDIDAGDEDPDRTEEPESAHSHQARRRPLLRLLDRLVAPPKKIDAVCDDDEVRIYIPFGWGMRQLDVKFDADIKPSNLEPYHDELDTERKQRSEAELGREMDALFKDSVSVFREHDEDTALPAAPWVKHALRYAAWFLVLGLLSIVGLTLATAVIFHFYGLIIPVVCMTGAVFFTFICAAMIVHRFRTDRLWPGLLEERLQAMTERRFPKADVRIRKVLNHLTSLFLDNNWLYVRIKRGLQIAAILSFYVAAVPIIVLIRVEADYFADPAVALLGVVWLAFWSIGGLVTFYVLNEEVYQDKYMQTLQYSTQKVSQMMLTRTNALNMLFQHYYNHIQTIQEVGEPVQVPGSDHAKLTEQEMRRMEAALLSMHDSKLKQYRAFHATRIMMWLNRRLEYLEWHMLHRMHSAQTIHGVINIAAFIATTSICLIGVVPMLAFLVYANNGIDFSIPVLGKAVSMVLAINILGIATILLTVWTSWRSYARKAWNSGKKILYDHFTPKELKGWWTASKQRYDLALAGRSQRAMNKIYDTLDLLKRGG